MGSAIGDLVINLLGNAAPLQQTLSQAPGMLRKFGNEAGSVAKSAGSLILSNFLPTLGAFGSVSAVVASFKKMGDQMKEVTNAAAQLNMSVETVQRLQKVASGAGKEFGVVEGAVARMEKAIAEASGGDRGAGSLFEKLKLDPRRLMLDSTENQFRAVARAVESIQNPTARTLALMEMFGKSGKELDSILKTVAAGKDMQKSAVSGESSSAINQFWANVRANSGDAWTFATETAGQLLRIYGGMGKSAVDLSREAAKAAREQQASAAAMERQATAAAAIAYHKKVAETGSAAAKSAQELIAGMQRQTTDLGLPEGQREEARRAAEFARLVQDIRKGYDGLGIELFAEIRYLQDAFDLESNRLAMAEKTADAHRRGQQLLEQLQSPAERYAARVKEIQALWTAGALGSGLDGLNAVGRAMEDAKRIRDSAAHSMLAQIGTPIEKLSQRLQDIKAMSLPKDLERRAMAMAGLESGLLGPRGASASMAAAVEFGSKDAYESIAHNIMESRSGDNKDPATEAAERSAELLNDIRSLLEREGMEIP